MFPRERARVMRVLLRTGGLVAAALLAVAGRGAAAPAGGWEYDEVVRLVSPAEAFVPDPAADRAAALAATPEPEPVRRRGRAAPAPAPVPAIAREAAMLLPAYAQALAAIPPAGRIVHHAFLGGYERIDDPAAETATIRKCDLGQVVRLDLRRRTYRVDDVLAEAVPVPPALSRPGTADVEVVSVATPLPERTIAGTAAAGVEQRDTVRVRNASGSCGTGDRDIAVRISTYTGRTEEPSAAGCLLAATLPATAVHVVAPPQTACRPLVSAQRSGPVVPAGRLVVARRLLIGDRVGIEVERADVRPLAAADAGRFEIPSGFTREP